MHTEVFDCSMVQIGFVRGLDERRTNYRVISDAFEDPGAGSSQIMRRI